MKSISIISLDSNNKEKIKDLLWRGCYSIREKPITIERQTSKQQVRQCIKVPTVKLIMQ